MNKENQSREIKLIRIYEAPVKLVWEAWTDPQKAALWWGPRGFSITTHSKELRVGGHWHYTMHGPDGTDYPNKTVYLEVETLKRLVYDHGGYDDRPPLFRVTVTFIDLGPKTRMEMIMALPTPEQAEQTKKFIKAAGGNATWDRLAEYLAKSASELDVFVINQSFDAQIDTVFEMWVNPDHFSRWLGPVNTKMEFIQDTIAEGSTTFYKMSYDTGLTLYGKMSYLKIKRPSYLEYTQTFCDQAGNLSRHPLAPIWPEQMLTRIFFSEEGPRQTRITLIWKPDSKTSKEELQTFSDMKASMTQGWAQTFDKLEHCLSVAE